jgi:hypothetical protein
MRLPGDGQMSVVDWIEAAAEEAKAHRSCCVLRAEF